MIALGLSVADQVLFHRSLATHHSVKVTVQVLTLNHAYLADVSTKLLDGQVNIDGDADVTRNLTMQLLDPDRTLQLDSTSPADGALFYDRMIRIVYSVKSELLPRWVDVPIFCGPITKMARTHEIINVEAMGKEHLAIPPTVAYYSKTWLKGLQRSAIAYQIMRDFAGETRFTMPNWPERTASAVVMAGESNMWALAKGVTGSRSVRHLFYDGRGYLCLRATPKTSTWTFKTGVGGNVLSYPSIDYDISTVVNMVRVKGAIPTGAKTPVTATVGAPATHPLTPRALGRNGKPRVIMEVVSDDNVKTAAQAKTLATSHLGTKLLQTVGVKFDSVVVPHLEPEDIYTLSTPEFAITSRVRQFTIPLKSAAMSIGTNTKRSTNKTGIRR